MKHIVRPSVMCLLCILLFAGCFNRVHRYGVFPNVEGLESYLANGGDPNAISTKDQKSKRTLLHNAAIYRDARMASSLIKAGANPNSVDVGGWTPLMALFTTRDESRGRREILEVLWPVTDLSIRDAYGKSALQLAAKHGTKEECSLIERAMLDAGLDPKEDLKSLN